jgi:LPXTG-motif cell wall-anchored protein
VKGSTATLPPAIQTSPTSGVLPFTGGSPAPLAGLGLVLLGTGAGLSRRKRRLAD